MFPGSTCLFSRPRLLQLHVARNCKESLGWGDYMALPRLQLVKCTLEGLQTEHAQIHHSHRFGLGPGLLDTELLLNIACRREDDFISNAHITPLIYSQT